MKFALLIDCVIVLIGLSYLLYYLRCGDDMQIIRAYLPVILFTSLRSYTIEQRRILYGLKQ